jgi:ankyrin repeat protein
MPGANLNRVGREGITLLFYAFNLKNYSAMTALVKAGANPEYEVQSFGSPMTVAVDQDDPSALKALLAGGANPNGNYTSDTPIIFKVADDDKIEHLKALLDAGANPNKKDSLGETALFEAMSISSYDATKLLIQRGADVNAMSNRGLTFAWVVQDKLNFQKNNSSHFERAREIQQLCEERGVKFPPDPPQVVRQKLGIPE